MKLQLTTGVGNNLITGYGEDWVEINTQRHTHSLILLPNQLITNWMATDLASLTPEHFGQLTGLKPEVVLLGTGKKHFFPHPGVIQALTESGISLESMNTAAACRTYNILMAENRHVAAALIIQPNQ